LKDVILTLRADEEGRRDENHGVADLLKKVQGGAQFFWNNEVKNVVDVG